MFLFIKYSLSFLSTLLLTVGCGRDFAPKQTNQDSVTVEPYTVRRIKAPCKLNSIDEAHFQKRLDDFKAKYGIDIQLAPNYDPKLKIQYHSIPSTELSAAEFYFNAMEKLMQKHPPEFLKTAGIKYFGFVQNPTFENYPVAGLALFDERHVLFSIDKDGCTEESVSDTFHHELFHMFHYVPDPPSFELAKWLGLNESGFSYSITSEKNTEMTHPKMGFVNEYAMTNELEDSAEVFTTMMVKDYSRALRSWTERDAVLLRKVGFLKSLLSRISPKYSPEYWENLSR